jgi:hypothetical protein
MVDVILPGQNPDDPIPLKASRSKAQTKSAVNPFFDVLFKTIDKYAGWQGQH